MFSFRSKTILGIVAIIVVGACNKSGPEEKREPETAFRALNAPPTIEQVSTKTADSFRPEQVGRAANGSVRNYLTPTPAENVTITGQGGVARVVRWASLTQDQVRGLLDQGDENVTIEQSNSDGGVTFLSSGATAKRGAYRVTYYYYRYRNQPCGTGTPPRSAVAVGIGVKVTAEIVTKKDAINVSDLIPLAIAANREYLSGRMRAQSFGLTGGTGNIASYLEASGGVNAETIRKAVESFGVVKALVETTGVTLSPNYLFIEGPDQQACAAQSVTKQD